MIACVANLTGWIEGEPWTRWKQDGEGQVRFWLKPLHASAGLLLCAVPVRSTKDLRMATEMLAPGRQVDLVAVPRAIQAQSAPRSEDAAGVVFLAREATVSGLPLTIAEEREPVAAVEHLAPAREIRPHGKMAAAGDGMEGDA